MIERPYGRDSNLWRGSRTAGAVPFFVSPKKGTPKKGDPGLRDTPRPATGFGARAAPTRHPAAGRCRMHPCMRPFGLLPKPVTGRALHTGINCSDCHLVPLASCSANGAMPDSLGRPGLRQQQHGLPNAADAFGRLSRLQYHALECVFLSTSQIVNWIPRSPICVVLYGRRIVQYSGGPSISPVGRKTL